MGRRPSSKRKRLKNTEENSSLLRLRSTATRSALGTSSRRSANRFDKSSRTSGVSLNNLIGGGQQRFRDGEAERFGCFEIDDQFDLRDLLHRQIGRLLAFENAPGIDAKLVRQIAEAAAIAHQTAGKGELREWVDRRHRIAGLQRRELFGALVVEVAGGRPG